MYQLVVRAAYGDQFDAQASPERTSNAVQQWVGKTTVMPVTDLSASWHDGKLLGALAERMVIFPDTFDAAAAAAENRLVEGAIEALQGVIDPGERQLRSCWWTREWPPDERGVLCFLLALYQSKRRR